MAPCGCGQRRRTITTGCGLAGNGTTTTPLEVATADWPYPCDIAAAAGGVYCDPETGELRGEPLPVTDYVSQNTGDRFPAPGIELPADTVSDIVVATHTYTITNPSPCRPAYVIGEKEIDMDLILPAGARGMYGMIQDVNGGAPDEYFKLVNTGSGTTTPQHAQLSSMWNTVIPPGGTHTETVQVTAGWGTNGASYTRVQTQLRAFILAL